MRECVAAIDQGTTGTRCILFDLDGARSRSAYREHRQIFPRPGWVEHDPAEILERVREVCAEALRARRPRARPSRSGSRTSARRSVAWERERAAPRTTADVSGGTRRTADMCEGRSRAGWKTERMCANGLPISDLILLRRSCVAAGSTRPEVGELAASRACASGRGRLLIWNPHGGRAAARRHRTRLIAIAHRC
jgi:glycerol kinase